MATDDQAIVGADVFDHIDDFLNFSCDDAIDDFPDGHTVAAAASDFPALDDPLNAGDSLFGVDAVSDGIEVPKLGSLEELDIGSADLDWVSHFLDDSAYFSLDLPAIPSTVTDKNNGSSGNKEVSPFRTSSPVSVLEPNTLGGSGGSSSSYSIATTNTATATSSSSSSSSSGFGGGGSGGSNAVASNPMPPICPPEAVVIPGRARTKRPRPSSFSARTHVTIPFVPPTSEPAAPIQSDPESFGEYDPSPMMTMTKKKKKKSMPLAAVGDEEAGSPPVRKCMHCQITKTPQWRAGPMGPKTLCNACGVRYKSGRLFPEYRPAASPTFVPSIHSNSHKKVVEMRIKAGQRSAAAGTPLPDNPAAKGCDLLQFIRRRD